MRGFDAFKKKKKKSHFTLKVRLRFKIQNPTLQNQNLAQAEHMMSLLRR